MNCSYRILKNVNIGQRVRKTADKTTVKFNNDPITGAEITRYDKMGFVLKHKDLPREIYLDFDQLPLTKLSIINGIIQDEITFVERLVGGGGTTSMFLMPTHWLDYQELLHDKRIKDAETKYTVSQLKPGENVISALCRDGNVMTYIGKYFVVQTRDYQRWGYREQRYYPYIDNAPERAFFAIETGNGKYMIKNYPITNKAIAELYKAEERGLPGVNETFSHKETNLDIIRYANHNKDCGSFYSGYEWKDYTAINTYDFIKEIDTYDLYITDTKVNFKEAALEFYTNNLVQRNEQIWPSEESAREEYRRVHRY